MHTKSDTNRCSTFGEIVLLKVPFKAPSDALKIRIVKKMW